MRDESPRPNWRDADRRHDRDMTLFEVWCLGLIMGGVLGFAFWGA